MMAPSVMPMCTSPQGLKPAFLAALSGTAKAVPFPTSVS